MPELPLVETFRQIFNENLLDKPIQSVEVMTPELLDGLDSQELQRLLVGHAFTETSRHGKYLFARIDRQSLWLVFHFGLFGVLRYAPDAENPLGRDPAFQRMTATFADGSRMGFENREMRGGRIAKTEDIETFLNGKKIGQDALKISQEDFLAGIKRYSRSGIKGVLMDQSWLAGVGNLVADELLYQMLIHPETKIAQLSLETLLQLYERMRLILKTMVDVRNVHRNLPDNYLLRTRSRYKACPRDGTRFEMARMAGRQTVFCPTCQPRIAKAG